MKGAPDKEAMLKDFVALAGKSSAEDLYRMARMLIRTNQGDLEKEMTELGKVLGKGAADKGLEEARIDMQIK